MIPEDMADEFLVRFGIIIDNADAAGMASAKIEYGDLLAAGTLNQALKLIGIIDIPMQNDEGGKTVIPDQIIDTAGNVAAVMGPVPVHGGIENKQGIPGCTGGTVQFAQEIVLQKSMGLRHTQTDPFRTVRDVDTLFHLYLRKADQNAECILYNLF